MTKMQPKHARLIRDVGKREAGTLCVVVERWDNCLKGKQLYTVKFKDNTSRILFEDEIEVGVLV